MPKKYIGDSASGDFVYADFDGEHLILTTESGNGITNTIYLDYEAWHELVDYYCKLWGA